MNVIGLIPAAGHSTRMGRPKLSLPLGDKTVLERVVECLRSAGVERNLVVIGPHVPELVGLCEQAGATPLLLREPTPDMRSTAEAGLCWIESNWRPTDDDAFLLAPADHPALSREVVRRLLDEPGADIVTPTFNGNRGHPTLIGWRHVRSLFGLPKELGLNSYLRQHPVREIAVDSPAVLEDLDTPEDYEYWRARCDAAQSYPPPASGGGQGGGSCTHHAPRDE